MLNVVKVCGMFLVVVNCFRWFYIDFDCFWMFYMYSELVLDSFKVVLEKIVSCVLTFLKLFRIISKIVLRLFFFEKRVSG